MRVGLFFDPCVHTIVNCTYRFIILLITDTFYEFKEKKKNGKKNSIHKTCDKFDLMLILQRIIIINWQR